MLIRIINYTILLRRRVFFNCSCPIEMHDEEKFRKRFRVSKFFFIMLLNKTGLSEEQSSRGLSLTPVIQLACVLRLFATGCFQVVSGDLCGISQSTISKLVIYVSKKIANLHNKYVAFPTGNKFVMNPGSILPFPILLVLLIVLTS